MGELEGGTTTGRLTFEIADVEDVSALVTLSGELDMATATELEAAVGPIVHRRPSRLIVDARGLTFADSSAIALLVRWANSIPQVELREPPDLLRAVIERMGLGQRLQITP